MNYSRFLNAARRLLMLSALVFAFASVASAEWKEKVLYSFQGLPNDGAYPAGGVVFDQAGNLYGATTDGGANNCPGIAQCGTVFQLEPPAKKGQPWTENLLHVFKGVNSNDGNTPVGGVIFDQAGNLYGTTAYGGTGNCMLFGGRVGCGTVYKLVPPKRRGGAWTETVLHSFQSGEDGYFPWGSLTFDSAGNLYGATQYGGGYGSCNAPYYQFCGTVFKLSPPGAKGGKWKEQVLYAFKSGKKGANPNGGLVLDDTGTIYGTTFYGGVGNCSSDAGVGCGIVFDLKSTKKASGQWTATVLHSFLGGAEDTNTPDSGLVLDKSGNLYGTTFGGENSGGDDGSVFKLTRPSKTGGAWREALLQKFQTCNVQYGCHPSGLVLGANGDLYVIAGVVFRMTPPTQKGKHWTLSLLYKFTGVPDGDDPVGLILSGTDSIYGATLYGGTGQACQGGCGTIFEVWP